MTFASIRVGAKVYDRWWPWQCGVIIKKMRTKVRIRRNDSQIITYDRAHCQFLEPVK